MSYEGRSRLSHIHYYIWLYIRWKIMATRTAFGFDYQQRQRSSHSISSLLKYRRQRLETEEKNKHELSYPKTWVLQPTSQPLGVELVPESFPWNNPFPGKEWLTIRLFSFLSYFYLCENGSLPTIGDVSSAAFGAKMYLPCGYACITSHDLVGLSQKDVCETILPLNSSNFNSVLGALR